MKIIDFNVQEPYKTFILNGIKIVEGRLNKGKFASLKQGDVLKFDSSEKFKIVDKKEYISFKEMIEKEGLENVIPDKDNIEEAVDVYYKFYTKEQEKEFGVLAIRIERV